MRPIQEPTVDERGDEHHPAFATISAIRGTGGGRVLFDSDILHQHTMKVTIQPATRQRDLQHDWIHGTLTPYIEVEMSEAQWASFISTPNSGSGQPCTVRYRDGEEVPGLSYDPRLALNMAETRQAAEEAFQSIQEAFQRLEEAISTKAPTKERNEALRSLKYTIQNAVPNVDYAGKKLVEQTEEVVQMAKYDIEAYVTAKALQLGVDTEALAVGDVLALDRGEPG